jgi:hypothetical protein
MGVASLAYPMSVDADDFGAIGDGKHDDTPAFQAAVNTVWSNRGGRVRIDGAKIYRLRMDLHLRDNVALVGDYRNDNGAVAMDPAQGRSRVVLAENASIVFSGKCCQIKGLMLVREGLLSLVEDERAFRGNGLRIDNDSYIESVAILGFACAVSPKLPRNSPRLRMKDVNIDCSTGVVYPNVYDIGFLRNVQVRPFLATADGDRRRSGAAFVFTNRNDWTRVIDCHAEGHAVGYLIEDVNKVSLLRCSAIASHGGAAGVVIRGASIYIPVSEMFIAGFDRGIRISSSGPAADEFAQLLQNVVIERCAIGVEILGCNVGISGLTVRNPSEANSVGVRIENTNSLIRIHDSVFHGTRSGIFVRGVRELIQTNNRFNGVATEVGP